MRGEKQVGGYVERRINADGDEGRYKVSMDKNQNNKITKSPNKSKQKPPDY
jgi:hypothetical protein